MSYNRSPQSKNKVPNRLMEMKVVKFNRKQDASYRAVIASWNCIHARDMKVLKVHGFMEMRQYAFEI